MRILVLAATAALVASVPVVSQAQDASAWAGYNVGVQFSTGDGYQQYDSAANYDLDGDSYGIFAGYMLTNGAWAYGGELSYSKADFYEIDSGGSPDPDYVFTSIIDLKARAGYAMGDALIYGTIGATFTKWQEDTLSGNDGSGFLYGVGVDYLVSPQVFLGAEYLVRDIESDWNNTGGTFDADLDTFTLRAGMKF
jgi:outer membrane immunogenic protein